MYVYYQLTIVYIMVFKHDFTVCSIFKICRIRDVLGTSDKTISKEDLGKLVYIEAIIKEVLRLYDITAALPRTLDKDIKLSKFI